MIIYVFLAPIKRGMRHISRGTAGVNETVVNVLMQKAKKIKKAPRKPEKVAGKARSVLSSVRYALLLVAKTISVFVRRVFNDFMAGTVGLRRWLNSPDGIAVVCSSGVVLLLTALWVVDAIRLRPETQSVEETAQAVFEPAPDPILATIGGLPVKLSAVVEYAHQSGKLPEGELMTAEEVVERGLVLETIDQLLLAQAAMTDMSIMADDDVLGQLDIARNRILAAAYLRKVIDEGAAKERARELYLSEQQNLAFRDDMKISHIILDDEAVAREVASLLEAGGVFEDLAREKSVDQETAQRGGALGYVSYAQMPESYAAVAYLLSEGQVSEPFTVGSKWVILRVEGRRAVPPPSFASVEGDIVEFLKLQAIEENLSRLRDEAEVRTFGLEDMLVSEETTVDALR